MPGVQRFARVLRVPDVARLVGAAVLARMPIGIDSLATVLFVRAETGSFARAGLVAAAFGLGVGCSAPVLGRLIDHHGHARVMLPLAGLHAASLGALVAFGLAGAPTGALVACGLAAGITIPPVGSVVRPLLAGLLEDDGGLLPTAYALDGIAIEVVFVTGPLLTAAIVIVASPAAALLVACGFVILGTIVLVVSPASRAWRPDAGDHERHLLGALTYGGREHTSAPGPRWVRLAVLFPVCSIPLLLAPSIAVMAPLAVIAGLCLAPYMAAANQLVGDVAPAGAVTEAFAWPITAIGLGAAGGSAAAGAIAQTWGWRPGFVAVVAAGAVAALIAVAGRATVRA